jgi:hypothetical protein
VKTNRLGSPRGPRRGRRPAIDFDGRRRVLHHHHQREEPDWRAGRQRSAQDERRYGAREAVEQIAADDEEDDGSTGLPGLAMPQAFWVKYWPSRVASKRSCPAEGPAGHRSDHRTKRL